MSLNVSTSAEDHFIVQVRERATGQICDVEYLCDHEFFFTGYQPEYRIFFKDEWEMVREPKRKPEERWLAMIAAITGTFVLVLILGRIVHILTQ